MGKDESRGIFRVGRDFVSEDGSASTWRCGRRRADGHRCRRALVTVAVTDEGDWRIRIRLGFMRVFIDEDHRVSYLGPGDLWYLDCHPRCGAHYTFTDAHVREFAARGGDLYLAEAVQAFQTIPMRSESNL